MTQKKLVTAFHRPISVNLAKKIGYKDDTDKWHMNNFINVITETVKNQKKIKSVPKKKKTTTSSYTFQVNPVHQDYHTAMNFCFFQTNLRGYLKGFPFCAVHHQVVSVDPEDREQVLHEAFD